MNTFTDKIKNTISSSNFLNYILLYFILFALVIVLPFFLYNLSKGQNIDSKYYIFLYFTIFGIALIFCFLVLIKSQKYVKLLFGLIIFIVTMIGILFFIFNKFSGKGKTTNRFMNIILGITLGLIVFIALALFYKVFQQTLENQSGIMNFIIQFIFFIPCFINEIVEYILNQYNNTSNSVFILFILEIVLLLCYFLIPIGIVSVLNKNGNNILPNAVFLKNPKLIASGDKLTYLEKDDPITGVTKKISLTSYAISMWIYINQHDHTLKKGEFKHIFSYMDSGISEAKPAILYYNDMDSKKRSKNVYKIFFQGWINTENTSYNIDLPGQKWNHLLFNYHNSSSVELFLNGVLVRNFEMEYKPKYSLGDMIIIGDVNGLDGSICNISYYSEPLTKYQITNLYNLYMNKNPPTFILQ
jgi:hypothetical protein